MYILDRFIEKVDGEDSVVEYVPDVVELLAPVVAVPAPKRANPEPLAPNPRPYAKRKCWTFGQKVSAIQKMERLSLTLCQAEKDLCIPFSNLQKWKKKKTRRKYLKNSTRRPRRVGATKRVRGTLQMEGNWRSSLLKWCYHQGTVSHQPAPKSGLTPKCSSSREESDACEPCVCGS